MPEIPEKIQNEIIKNMKEYPLIFPCHISVLDHMLLHSRTGYEWNDNGELVCNLKGKKGKRPRNEFHTIPMVQAKYLSRYGYRRTFHPFLTFAKDYSPITKIPKNITKDWLDTIIHFLYLINKINLEDYKIQLLAYHVQMYQSASNHYVIVLYKQGIDTFTELRTFTNKLAHDLKADWASWDNLNDKDIQKKKNDEASKIVNEILEEEGVKYPKAVRELSVRRASDMIREYGKEVFEEALKR